MSDLAAWIAEKRAASEPLPDEQPWLAQKRHERAFPPATTRRLLDAVEALSDLYAEDIDYIGRNKLAGAENNHAMRRAKAALDALRGGDE